MKLNVFQKFSGLLLVGMLASPLQAQMPDIPAGVSGTYTLTYKFGTSPFPAGSTKTFVLNGATDTMCVDGVSLGTGYIRSGGTEFLWADTTNSVYYALSLQGSGAFNEINVYSPNDQAANWKGQFTGSVASSSTTCGSASATLTLSTDQQAAIDLAAGLYPDLFSGGGAVKTAQGYTYQTFASGVTVGFKDGALYVAGGPFGPAIQSKGTIAAVTASLTSLKNSVNVAATTDMTNLFTLAAQAYPTLFSGGGTSFQTSADGYLYKYFASSGLYAAIKNGSVYVKGGSYGNAYTSVGALNSLLSALDVKVHGGTGIPQGDFNLTVSGTVSISGPISVSQPFSYTITGIPAPDVSDQQDIRDAFVSSLNSSGVTINSFNYTVVENAANRVEFSVSVSATTSGIGYNYVLNYVYSK